MGSTIVLAADVAADADKVYEALSTTAGQRAFWTEDCDVSSDKARFGFPGVPVNIEADVTTEAGKLVRMTVTKGFPGWEGSTWEWELGPAARAETGTSVLFRHGGFGAGYGEGDVGFTAQTWAMIMDRLGKYLESGKPQPYFPAAG